MVLLFDIKTYLAHRDVHNTIEKVNFWMFIFFC
jgi:hypothetical protein